MNSLQTDVKQKVENMITKSRGDVNAEALKLYMQILQGVSNDLGSEYDQLSKQILLLDTAHLDDVLTT